MEKRGNIKLILVILVIVIVIAILLYIIFVGFKSNQNSNDLYKELLNCNNLDEQSLLNKCIDNWELPEICRYAGKDGLIGFCIRIVTRQSHNSKICDFYNTTNEKDFCYNDVAMGSGNQDICNKIIGVDETWEGKPINRKVENCYSNVAVLSLSEKMCLVINTDFIRDGCYGAIAKAKNDKNICNLITDNRSKELCLR